MNLKILKYSLNLSHLIYQLNHSKFLILLFLFESYQLNYVSCFYCCCGDDDGDGDCDDFCVLNFYFILINVQLGWLLFCHNLLLHKYLYPFTKFLISSSCASFLIIFKLINLALDQHIQTDKCHLQTCWNFNFFISRIFIRKLIFIFDSLHY